ncbi:MAG: hypothetical protein GWN31_13325 [Candidatus Thorarchaeota archaeon]|nr:hypothetical protein [Candidatus Thorarchaeota archaeon]NIW14875.1 hypothetical protein [Candidatus Thorarchaeota archaeon]
MRLSKYIQVLQEIEEKYGGDLEMIYAIDEEGNAFHPVHYKPNAGCYTRHFNEFYPVGTRDFDDLSEEANCVCVN